MNVACLKDDIFDEDLVALINYWRMEDNFCENIKHLYLDNTDKIVLFEGCTMKSVLVIFTQCPYLVLADNEMREGFMHSGEDLDVTFLFEINWKYEL